MHDKQKKDKDKYKDNNNQHRNISFQDGFYNSLQRARTLRHIGC